MNAPSPVSPAEEARAHREEWDRLLEQRRVLAPGDRCFCGSIEDLRRYVAVLEARHGHHASQQIGRHAEHQEQERDQPEREIEDEEIEP